MSVKEAINYASGIAEKGGFKTTKELQSYVQNLTGYTAEEKATIYNNLVLWLD